MKTRLAKKVLKRIDEGWVSHRKPTIEKACAVIYGAGCSAKQWDNTLKQNGWKFAWESLRFKYRIEALGKNENRY